MKLIKKIYFLLNKFKFNFPIQKIEGKFTLILPDKYKKLIKFIRWIITISGLIIALFTLPVLIAVSVALFLLILGKVFEKIIFAYYTIFIPPLPDFDIDNSKWIGVGFGEVTFESNKKVMSLVSWIFSDRNYARKIHSTLFAWLYEKTVDKERNINQSVVLHDNNTYSFFCYPSFERKYAKLLHKKVEKEKREKKSSRDDIHKRLFLTFIFMRIFEIKGPTFLHTFRNNYKTGIPYLFKIMYSRDGLNPQSIDNLDDFFFCNLKIINEKDLTKKEFEYDLIRLRE